MAEFVSVEVSNGVATLQRDRPPMNALCMQMQRQMKADVERRGNGITGAALAITEGDIGSGRHGRT